FIARSAGPVLRGAGTIGPPRGAGGIGIARIGAGAAGHAGAAAGRQFGIAEIASARAGSRLRAELARSIAGAVGTARAGGAGRAVRTGRPTFGGPPRRS